MVERFQIMIGQDCYAFAQARPAGYPQRKS
jgi:hypothetical protein